MKQFLLGGSISSLLFKYGSFKENIVRLYTKQILEGLEYLHLNNVLHRGTISFIYFLIFICLWCNYFKI